MYRRSPAVSGAFYPSSSSELRLAVGGYLEKTPTSPAVGIVSPHAGYVYSGPVKGAVYSRVEIPPTVILLGPNHRLSLGESYGKATIMASGSFITPIGEVGIDEALAGDLLRRSDMIREDAASHGPEHSLEVQLPFLKVKRSDVSIVPLLMNVGWREDHRQLYEWCSALAESLASAIRNAGRDVLIVASSDMNHYESRAETSVKDGHALDRIVALDAAGLLEVTEREHITVCGKVGVAAMIEASLRLGAGEAEVVKHGDSGDYNGELDSVVGYAGVIIH